MESSNKVHCIGIGGIGLSGLAQIFNEKGFVVSGSDIEDTPIIKQMQKKGISVYIGHSESHITNDISKVIYSSAIPKSNPEYKKAKQLNIPTISFSQAVKEFTENNYTIAVAGTHGKTTVTAFTSIAMMAGEKDPTVIIGSNLKEFNNNNYRLGQGELFIVEACEYKRNFLNYNPDIIILTNIEAEHLDYFKDLEDYKKAFKQFISKVPKNGFVVANADDKNVMDLISGLKCNVVLFSTKNKNCDWYLNKNEIWKAGVYVGDLTLNIPGEFNKLNALCGLIVGQIFNVDRERILSSFKNFKGAWRRFEEIGYFSDMKLISDYAHHPTEIKKTLNAAKEKYPDARLCCVFQPHQYNRTKKFLPEFANAFKNSTITIIPDIYKVRDKKSDIEDISSDILVKALLKENIEAYQIEGYNNIENFLFQNKDKIDIIFIMGAGDIWTLGEYLLEKNNPQSNQ